MFLNFTIFGGARPLEFKSYTTSVYIAIDRSTIYQDKSHYYYSQQERGGERNASTSLNMNKNPRQMSRKQ